MVESIAPPGGSDVDRLSDLEGDVIDAVESRGKHLSISLQSGLVIHSHMGMTGSWHIYRPTDAWQKPKRQATLVLNIVHEQRQDLRNRTWCVVCFTPKLIEIITATEFRRNNYLQRLGPDLLGPDFDIEQAASRFRTQRSAPIGEVVMNQTVVSGIGNIYKSEVLFLEQHHPLLPVDQLTDEQIVNLIERARNLMTKNLDNKPRRTRFRESGPRLWVYDRVGETCFKCGTTIEMLRQGDLARSTYYCPACQRAEDCRSGCA